jgi:hypothetical protein
MPQKSKTHHAPQDPLKKMLPKKTNAPRSGNYLNLMPQKSKTHPAPQDPLKKMLPKKTNAPRSG